MLIEWVIVVGISQLWHMVDGIGTCASSFPNVDTVNVLDQIVRRYAHQETYVDYSLGMRTTRKVITESNTLKVDEHQLYLEPRFVARECTYRFEAKRFFRVPIYVHTSIHEEAHPFNRLHFVCPAHTTCCGLFCCPHETDLIQQKFIAMSSSATDSSDFRRIDDDAEVTENGVRYSLKPATTTGDDDERVCVYHLSYDDVLKSTARLASEQPLNAIFFRCPATSRCCQLKCAPYSSTLGADKAPRTSRYTTRFYVSSTLYSDKVYLLGLALLAVVLVAVAFALCWLRGSQKEQRLDSDKHADKLLRSSESVLV